jgi:hypothetical protein
MYPAGYPENMTWIFTCELFVHKAVLTYLNASSERSMALFALPVQDQAIPGARPSLMTVAERVVALYPMLVHLRTEDTHAVVPETVNLGMNGIQTSLCFVKRIDDQELVLGFRQLLQQ